jgi:hypothetical protein
MFTDVFILTGMNSAVRFHSNRGATVYYYLFDYRGSNSFISLVTNSTVDAGECLQFEEHAKHLQWAVWEFYIYFFLFLNTQLSMCTPTHAHTIYMKYYNVNIDLYITTQELW